MAVTATQLLKEYKQYNMPGFIDALEKGYGERTNYNKDLIEQENRLTQEQLALPAQLREQYYASPIRNALAQESLIAGRQANVGSQLGTVTDLLNARKQQYADILGKASGAYQMNMENAWRLYQDAVNREEAARNRAASGGGGMPDLSALFRGSQQGPQKVNAKPSAISNIPINIANSPFWNKPQSAFMNNIGRLVYGLATTDTSQYGPMLQNPINLNPFKSTSAGLNFYKQLLSNLKRK